MTTTKTNANGQERKTLASQIDRLDSILDGLSEALSESVSTAFVVAQVVECRGGPPLPRNSIVLVY
jgi:hypothetical protein